MEFVTNAAGEYLAYRSSVRNNDVAMFAVSQKVIQNRTALNTMWWGRGVWYSCMHATFCFVKCMGLGVTSGDPFKGATRYSNTPLEFLSVAFLPTHVP